MENFGGDGFKSGMIMLWSGSIASIPPGWALCDGASGTPDLGDKFVVCASGDQGGVAKTIITGSALQTGGNTSHMHTLPSTGGDFDYDLSASPPGEGTYTGSTDSASNVPPFYALAYIMKL